jgi:hypothetical protein
MSTDTRLRLHNITLRATFNYGSETWISNQKETQKLEAAQMCFLRPPLGFTRLEHQRF